MTFSPTYVTPPLSEDYTSAVDDRILDALEIAWGMATPGFKFHEWQRELLRRMFETFPPGHPKEGTLRFREYAVSVARQNGKTELMAAAAIANLIWRDEGNAPKAGTYTIGVASTADQARIVHRRILRIVEAAPFLRKRMRKITDTRGIATVRGNVYEIKANRAGIIQGIDLATAIMDETHLGSEDVYNALQAGLGARDSAILLSITTAGDENSKLLKGIYERGIASLEDPNTRMGFCAWEAEAAVVPDDDAELLRLLRQANPSLSEGFIDEDNLIADVRAMRATDIVRYRLNRFTEAVSEFISPDLWAKRARPFGAQFPVDARPLVFAIDKSPDWAYASIVAVARTEDEKFEVDLVRSIRKPTLTSLLEEASALAKFGPAAFVVDSASLRDLGEEMRRRGFAVEISTYSDLINGSAYFYRVVQEGRISHDNNPLLARQLRMTKTRDVGENWRIARKDSSQEIDAVVATVIGVMACANIHEAPIAIY